MQPQTEALLFDVSEQRGVNRGAHTAYGCTIATHTREAGRGAGEINENDT